MSGEWTAHGSRTIAEAIVPTTFQGEVGLSTTLPDDGIAGDYQTFPCTVDREGANIVVSCDATWEIHTTGWHWLYVIHNGGVLLQRDARDDRGFLYARDIVTYRGWRLEF